MSDRRRVFGRLEKAAGYVASGGVCSLCGEPLSDGWHADHIVPWSKGGATDATNLQATCPTCNQRKGAKVDDGLRDWQRAALAEWRKTTDDFLAVATPGAGKTTFALHCMRDHHGFFLVVVPSIRLRRQWSEAAHEVGIYLRDDFTNGDGIAEDVRGLVVTYQAVASSPELYRMFAARDAMVVLDEVHHCGDSETWGDSIRYAFEPASRRLLLSGTPFRKPSSPIPFVTYKGDPPTSRPDYRYGYGPALRDGVVRSVEFSCEDGYARWASAGQVEERWLDDTSDYDEGKALLSALHTESEWMNRVLPEADRHLQHLRSMVPDAGGLIVAADQISANKLATKMSAVVGYPVPVAVSDNPDAHAVIERFANGSVPWLVAVKMVSEGVDIPRLMVLVYATRDRTDLFFRQVVGRVVRTRGDEERDSYPAAVFLPATPTLVECAKEIEQERDHVLREALERPATNGDGPPPMDFLPLPASDARHHSTIFSGEGYSPEELEHARRIIEACGLLNVTPAQVARVGREYRRKVPAVPTPAVDSSFRDRKRKRKEMSALVKKVAYHREMEHAHVWTEVHKRVGQRTLNEYTADDLDYGLKVLAGWLNGG